MNCVRGVGARVGHVLAWAVIVAVVAVLAGAVLVPRFAGATPYAVLTGSMQPDLGPGTLVVVKPKPIEEIGIGDVVTYQLKSGELAVVTHRVVGIGVDADGDRVLQTQGDANEAFDPEPVREVQLKGELWYSAPYLGRLHTIVTGQQRQWAVYGVATLLLGYAALAWAGAARDRLRRHPENTHDQAEETDDATTYAPTPS
jgi:signal peptidase I